MQIFCHWRKCGYFPVLAEKNQISWRQCVPLSCLPCCTVCIDTPVPAVCTSEVTRAGVHSSSASSRCKLTSSKCCCTSHSVVIFIFHEWEMMLTWLKVYWSWVDGRCACIVPDSRPHAPESHILIKWDLWRVEAASFVIFLVKKIFKGWSKKKKKKKKSVVICTA